jgi:hypothetical protein
MTREADVDRLAASYSAIDIIRRGGTTGQANRHSVSSLAEQ